MKKSFVSFFVIYFIVDSILSLCGSLLRLYDATLPIAPSLILVVGVFRFLIIPFAIIQLTISLKNKLKISATILGLFPLVIAFISLSIGIYLFMIKQTVIDTQEYLATLNIVILIVGLIQLSVGVWAATDLSKGHYRVKMD